MTPTYPPEFIFGFVEPTEVTECYFCPDPIALDETFIEVSIPHKKLLNLHRLCCDQMAWSMFHFLLNNAPAVAVSN